MQMIVVPFINFQILKTIKKIFSQYPRHLIAREVVLKPYNRLNHEEQISLKTQGTSRREILSVKADLTIERLRYDL